MPDAPFSIRSDGVLEMFVNNAQNAPAWMPRVFESGLTFLGRQIALTMKAEVASHRYTGALEDSIDSQYTPTQVEIGPNAKRGGSVDAGTVLELGTNPIPNLPWSPIKRWADFRGIEAGPVWRSIREHGVKPHPFLERTLDHSANDIEQAAQTIADMSADRIVGSGGGAQVKPMGQ